jgi:hypothetical protein
MCVSAHCVPCVHTSHLGLSHSARSIAPRACRCVDKQMFTLTLLCACTLCHFYLVFCSQDVLRLNSTPFSSHTLSQSVHILRHDDVLGLHRVCASTLPVYTDMLSHTHSLPPSLSPSLFLCYMKRKHTSPFTLSILLSGYHALRQ